MNDDAVTESLRRLADRSSPSRPLDPEAKRRVQARIDAAFEREERAVRGADDPVDLVLEAETGPAVTRRRWPIALAAAAVVVVIVAVAVRLGDDTPEPVADEPPPTSPASMLAAGARWQLSGPAPTGGDGSTATLAVRITEVGEPDDSSGERQVSAIARVSTSDAPPLQYQGSITFVIDEDGGVRLPLVLLDPERDWLDCDATIDATSEGTASCGTTTIRSTPTSGPIEPVETGLGTYQASKVTFEWGPEGTDPTRTTVWIAPGVGPVRLEVDDGGAPIVYQLTDLTEPTDPPPPTAPDEPGD